MNQTIKPVPPPAIPGFELFECLGEGGMGVVFKARQIAMDRMVAIKILRDELAQEPEYITRFFREARMAGRLRHAGIVSALDCGSADGRYYMVMEYVEGLPLDKFLRSKGKLTEAEALEICLGITEAIQYAWRHKIIHRDLKPQNILLTQEGRPKVNDFGLCRDVRDLPHLTSLGLIHCTPEYSSPEQARGDKDIDVRADLYSLGATLYELLTGVLPFEASDAATMIVRHAMDRVRPPVEHNPAISPMTNQLVLDLLEKAREERPATPQIVIDRIKGLQGQQGKSGNTGRRNTRSFRTAARQGKGARSPAPVLAIVGVVLLIAILSAAVVLRPAPAAEKPAKLKIVQLPDAPPPEPTPDEMRRLNLSRFLKAYETGPDGGVNHWLVLGPLPKHDSTTAKQAQSDNPIPGLEFAKADGAMVRWTRTETGSGTLDFSQLEGWRDDGTPFSAVASCWIECTSDVSVELRFTISGGYEFQLDRRVLLSAPKGSSEPLRQKIVLGKGWHNILIQAERQEEKLRIGLRVVTPEGNRLPEIRVWQ